MKIGAAWRRTTEDGKSYTSCVIKLPFLGKINFAIFPNENKGDNEKAPDGNIVWNERDCDE